MRIANRWVWAIVIGSLSVIGTGSLAFGKAIHGRWDIVSVQGVNVLPGGVASAMANDGTLITFTGSGTFVAPAGGQSGIHADGDGDDLRAELGGAAERDGPGDDVCVGDAADGGDRGRGHCSGRNGHAATSSAVTGGGRWEIQGFLGIGSASGTYWVTGLVRFEPAPGTLPPVNDLVGNPDEASAGLIVLRLAYSDGSHGILVISSRLVGAPDAPDTVFEGITATKGFVDFWRRLPPINFPFFDANRTLFHVRQ